MNGVSIIVCTYNGRERISDCLASLAVQQVENDYPVEVIIVDNRSSDNTAAVAKEAWNKMGKPFPLRLLNEIKPGKAYALETGFDAASYETMIICDDDNRLAPDYVALAFKTLTKFPDVGIVGSQSNLDAEVTPPYWFNKFHRSYAVGMQFASEGLLTVPGTIIWGAGMVVRRSYWQYLRSFGYEFFTGKKVTKAVGEDSELSLLAPIAGYKLYYQPSLKLQHSISADRLVWTKYMLMCKGFGHTQLVLDYYEQFQLMKAEAPSPEIHFSSSRRKLRAAYWNLAIQTSGRSIFPVLLPEGSKFSVRAARLAGMQESLKSRSSAIEQLSRIYKILYSICTASNRVKSIVPIN